MKRLLELEVKLRKAKEELEKGVTTTAPPSSDGGDDGEKKPKKGHSSFTMDHVNDITKMIDHTDAKSKAHSIVDSSTANPKNKQKMKMMINRSKSTAHLAQGMTNHILAHPSEDLKVLKSDLTKSLLGDMNPTATEVEKMDAKTGMPAGSADVNMAKEDVETCGKMDSKKDQKIIAEALDDHNDKKYGEAKDEDSAKKSDIPKEITDQTTSEIITDVEKPKVMETTEKGCNEMVKFEKNGQWSLTKATISAKPSGEFDVPVKGVYNGDDEFVHVGSRSVDGDKPGKERKVSDDEKKMLKE